MLNCAAFNVILMKSKVLVMLNKYFGVQRVSALFCFLYDNWVNCLSGDVPSIFTSLVMNLFVFNVFLFICVNIVSVYFLIGIWSQ